jgi:hypothetical protein
MFNDASWVPNTDAKMRFEVWRAAVLSAARCRQVTRGDGAPTAKADDSAPSERSVPCAPLAVTILEIGCGNNVTTIRQRAESFASSLRADGAIATIVRVNPEFPLCASSAATPVPMADAVG